jgi:hypothetical protein
VNPEVLDRVMAETGETSKSRAVEKVLEDYLRRVKLEKLKSMAGKLDLDDSWKLWRTTKLGQLRTAGDDEHGNDI